MPARVFYSKENEEFKDLAALQLTNEQAFLVARKLISHYGRRYHLKGVEVTFHKGRSRSYAYPQSSRIELRQHPPLLHVIHELAHIIHYKKWHSTGHDKKLMTIIRRIATYVRGKECWGLAASESLSSGLARLGRGRAD